MVFRSRRPGTGQQNGEFQRSAGGGALAQVLAGGLAGVLASPFTQMAPPASTPASTPSFASTRASNPASTFLEFPVVLGPAPGRRDLKLNFGVCLNPLTSSGKNSVQPPPFSYTPYP